MNIYFLIFMMLLIQSTIYAETTAKVRLSIRLFPIQYIKVNQSDTQTLKLSSENSADDSQSHKLSTYSTSQFTFKIDTVNSNVFKELSDSRVFIQSKKKPIDGEFYAKKIGDEIDINDLHLIYSMETL